MHCNTYTRKSIHCSTSTYTSTPLSRMTFFNFRFANMVNSIATNRAKYECRHGASVVRPIPPTIHSNINAIDEPTDEWFSKSFRMFHALHALPITGIGCHNRRCRRRHQRCAIRAQFVLWVWSNWTCLAINFCLFYSFVFFLPFKFQQYQ